MAKIFFLLCNKMGNSHRAKEAHIAHSRSSQSEQRIRFILPEAPGGSSWEFLVGVCCPVLQILTLSQTQKCHFSRPSSELACKNYVIITQTRTVTIACIFFFVFSFGTETINKYIHSRSSLENHTRFQTKVAKVHTSCQTKMAQKPYPLGRHKPIRLI